MTEKIEIKLTVERNSFDGITTSIYELLNGPETISDEFNHS